MARQFADQGGMATSNPSKLMRWATSRLMQRMADPKLLEKKRSKAEKQRRKTGMPHRVEYFHQVDDGYSHLAVQTLKPLLETYDIELLCHLAGPTAGKNAPEPELLLDYARTDSASVAPHYGLQFPMDAVLPMAEQVELATCILANVDNTAFSQVGVDVGQALWSANSAQLNALAQRHGRADPAAAAAKVQAGSDRRAQLQHYSGAMFYYAGEWYWGVDRLYHLENRLISLGARKPGVEQLIAPRPAIEAGGKKDNGTLTLEIYPSLRSPYTSIIFDATVKLAHDTGVKAIIRPVLPMVMRGVPATRQKGMYIFFDTAREARTLGLNWGNAYDPIGDPVRRAYSLYPWAEKHNKGVALLSTFLRAAFFDAVNTNTESGMRSVVEKAGLVWQDAKNVIDNTAWEDELEQNRLAMYGFGSWGVPSFRLLNAGGESLLAVWGQDRLWLVAREIQRQLGNQ